MPVEITWVDWRLERYTSQNFIVQVVDAGLYPTDITGWVIRWTSPYLTKSTTAGTIILTAPASGVFTFSISATESLLFPFGDYGILIEHQCKGQTPAGEVHLIFKGRLRYTGTLITSV